MEKKMTTIARNPVMPGFYPDPSICAVGGDYYLVNSTFAYFPGLPVFHSRDLSHWEQIGNVLDREEQLPLKGAGHSQGLFAPTIRYHAGIFYVICTNVSGGGNFIVTAENPAGPWSNPHYLPEAGGIDPSLFFDEDGKCYYIGTHPNPDGCKYDGDWYIWIRELDVEKMKLVGEEHNVWNGAMKGVHWPEGPHLYKIGEYYYIMHAEGGTGPDHAVTVCRSRNIFGPYENNFCNPILTHRHLGQMYPVKYVGHADLIETPAGEWYMTMLAVRPLEGYTTMGRETFLAKVVWENGWPVVNPGVGMLTDEVEIGLPEWNPAEDLTFDTTANAIPGSNRVYEFAKADRLGDEFLALRNPGENLYTLDGEGLKLHFRKTTLKEMDSPAYLALRQQHHSFTSGTSFDTEQLTQGRRAGIALVQSNEYHLRAEAGFTEDGRLVAEAILCEKGADQVLARAEIPDATKESAGQLSFRMRVNGLTASVEAMCGDGSAVSLCSDQDIRALSTEVAGGFVGCTVGMYAVASGDCDSGAACFKTFSYQA